MNMTKGCHDHYAESRLYTIEIGLTKIVHKNTLTTLQILLLTNGKCRQR